MVRIARVLLVGLLLAALGWASAADTPAGPAGNWKFSFLSQGRLVNPWILKLEQKDGKWTGEVVATAEGAPKGVTVDDVSIKGDQFSLNLIIQGQKLNFEGKLAQGKEKKVLGSLLLGRLVPAEMEPTKLATLDPYETAKETVAKGEPGPDLFQAALTLLAEAAAKKATPEEVRSWANKAFTAAEVYGRRWQREMALSIAQNLLSEESFAPLALEYARKAHRLVEPSEPIQYQMRVLSILAATLNKAGKKEEAKGIDKEADTLYLKRMPPFPTEKRAGQPKANQRRVLVELFTGAQCGPCLAADLAFDGVEKSYPPAEVVLLQYHLHIPGPDPLSNDEAQARGKYYDEEVDGTPTVLFNGKLKSKASGGGSMDDAKEKFQDYRDVIDGLLEQTTPLKLTAQAVRKGDKLEITATAADVPNPGEKIRLRLALVEEAVRYVGANQARFHHHIVRELPGGAAGLPLKTKTGKQQATVDLAQLRDKLKEYVADLGKKTPFPNDSPPLDLKNLYVVAFVQNDENKEVLQSVQVKVGATE